MEGTAVRPRLIPALAALAVHPSLWPAAWRLVPPGWWRRRPYLPLPDPAYMRFRMETQYGDASHAPDPHDLVTYLRWARDFK